MNITDLFEAHRKKAFISCDETCFCWDVEKGLLGMEPIKSVQIVSGKTYYVKEGDWDDVCDLITIIEKNGDMAHIEWYQLWKGGQVVKEINSRYVVEVEYFKMRGETDD